MQLLSKIQLKKLLSTFFPEKNAAEEVDVKTVTGLKTTESKETASTSSSRSIKISKPPATLPSSPVMQDTVTLRPFGYHQGGVHEHIDACPCITGWDPCDCSCACDELQMA